jgi:hypothetical protein
LGEASAEQRKAGKLCVEHYLCDICMLQIMLKLIINPGVPFLEDNSFTHW